MPKLIKFNTWQEVLDHVSAQKPVWYQAPLDPEPTKLSYTTPDYYGVRLGAKNTVRIRPPHRSGDAFAADKDHLHRFLREAT